MRTVWNYYIPLKTVSEANNSDHWTKKSKRHKLQKLKVKAIFLKERPPITIPCSVVLVRIAPRELDEHDNLRTSLKYIVDAISEYLIPGKAIGRADDCKEITWDYKQEKGDPKEYAISIQISCDS